MIAPFHSRKAARHFNNPLAICLSLLAAFLFTGPAHLNAQESSSDSLAVTSLTNESVSDEQQLITSEAANFQIETVADGFQVPWAMTFLPDDFALIAERDIGQLSRVNLENGERTTVTGLPDMLRNKGVSAGLFDVRLHPEFETSRWLYLVYATGTAEASGLIVERFELNGDQLSNGQILLETGPKIAAKWHFGGRLVLRDGYIFLSTGDGYEHPSLAQDLSSHAAKILRIHDDGRIPADNPFVHTKGALPEIWAYGVRNPQGMALHPDTGDIWFNEHGPQGGDEVNIATPGTNFGWPVITYGEEYGGGPIGEGISRKQGLQQPLYYWLPSIAPSGMAFYTGNAFPKWKGNIFIGALAKTHINRLVIDQDRVMHEERLLDDKNWRVRFVEQGPDGYLYFGVDDGMIMRLVPDS